MHWTGLATYLSKNYSYIRDVKKNILGITSNRLRLNFNLEYPEEHYIVHIAKKETDSAATLVMIINLLLPNLFPE